VGGDVTGIGTVLPGERRSDVRDLSDRFNELRSRGQGYLKVRLPDSEFPQLSLGIRDDHAVIHLINDAEGMSLLVGDGTVPSRAVVNVPIMTVLESGCLITNKGGIATATLSASGVYIVSVDPAALATGALSLAVTAL
jgi:hypothetical protein